MYKTELLSQLQNAKNNFILVLASISLLCDSRTYHILEESNCTFGKYNISFSQISNMMKGEKDKNIACKEFVNMGLRFLIKESFELIKDYSKNTGQNETFKSQQWYQFARIIRNCLSHNFKFQFSSYDKEILPVSWKNKTINLSFDNNHLELSFLGYIEAYELFDEMNLFVKDTLN